MELFRELPYSSSDIIGKKQQYNKERFTIFSELDELCMSQLRTAREFIETPIQYHKNRDQRLLSRGECHTLFHYIKKDGLSEDKLNQILTASRNMPFIAVMGLKVAPCKRQAVEDAPGTEKGKSDSAAQSQSSPIDVSHILVHIENKLKELKNESPNGGMDFLVLSTLSVNDAYVIVRANDLEFLSNKLPSIHFVECQGCENKCICVLQGYTVYGFANELRLFDDNDWDIWAAECESRKDSRAAKVILQLRAQTLPGVHFDDVVEELEQHFSNVDYTAFTTGRHDVIVQGPISMENLIKLYTDPILDANAEADLTKGNRINATKFKSRKVSKTRGYVLTKLDSIEMNGNNAPPETYVAKYGEGLDWVDEQQDLAEELFKALDEANLGDAIKQGDYLQRLYSLHCVGIERLFRAT